MPSTRPFSELSAAAKNDPVRAERIERSRQASQEEMRHAASEFAVMQQRVKAAMTRNKHIIERLERT